MSPSALVVRVHLHAPRFHGAPDWPPSPARLFQALVAGAGPRLQEPAIEAALSWLETLPPPVIAVPRHTPGQEVTLYVPNNDLDAKGGDPARIGEIRAAKAQRPRLLTDDAPLVYVWSAPSPVPVGLPDVVDGLYQLGRGIDPAWAQLDIVDPADADALIATWPGDVHRPSPGATGGGLPCPVPGTLVSLKRRHAAAGARLTPEKMGRKVMAVFRQPPKARFAEVPYGSAAAGFLFELAPADGRERFVPWPLVGAHLLAVAVRDAAVARLDAAFDGDPLVGAALIGRRPGEPERVRQERRVRIVPLPSIGHVHTDPSIRRVWVEVPHGGPLDPADVRWAFGGLGIDGRVLVDATDRSMLDHYRGPSRRWTSRTPVALPVEHPAGAATPDERAAAAQRAIAAVHQAVRHARVGARPSAVHVQREPLQPSGARADGFVAGRFRRSRLWHVEIVFDRPCTGPLVIGNGRYLGLGVLEPALPRPVLRAWTIRGGLTDQAEPLGLARALRRAVMARSQRTFRRLPVWISGHRSSGAPAEGHDHFAYFADLGRRRIVLVDPGGAERGRRDVERVEAALDGFTELRAGGAGRLRLARAPVDADEPLLQPSLTWRTVTPYAVLRHRKAGSASAAVEADVRTALRQRGRPEPTGVEIDIVPSERGLSAHVGLSFASAQRGPLFLGRTCHQGGGWFEPS